jgi:hypothetical protein
VFSHCRNSSPADVLPDFGKPRFTTIGSLKRITSAPSANRNVVKQTIAHELACGYSAGSVNTCFCVCRSWRMRGGSVRSAPIWAAEIAALVAENEFRLLHN